MPLKEGRSYPGGLPYAGGIQNGRFRFNQRQALVIVFLLLGLPLLYLYVLGGSITGAPAPGGANTRLPTQGHDSAYPGAANVPNLGPEKVLKTDPEKAIDNTVGISREDAPAAKKVIPDESPKKVQTSETPKSKPPVDVDDDEEPVRKPVPQSSESLKKHKQAPYAEKFAERAGFDKSLSRIIELLPDEVHMRELTRDVDSTGKERMREMGLRSTAYKEYFDAWEALHLLEDAEGNVHVQDDVAQYLRSHQSSGSSGDGGIMGLGLAQTLRSYESYRSFMIKMANLLFPWTAPYFSDHLSLHAHFKKGGRGIVLTAGDDQAPYLLTTIYTFRKLGCTLPIEVMYLGDQDLGEDYRAELEALDGVVTRDIAAMVNDEGWRLAGWAAKPFAILLSSFREVIFIDADSLFFKDPAVLFDEPGYKETGALFFRDRLMMPESKKRWLQQILPKPIPKAAKKTRFWTGQSGHQQESGVVVVDKWRHFIPLLLVTRFNGPDRDGNKERGIIGVYDMVYGDKETFWLSWLLCGDEDFQFHQGDAGIMGMVKDPDDHTTESEHGEHAHHDNPAHPDGPGHEGISSSSDLSSDQSVLDAARASAANAQNSQSVLANYTICAPQLLHLDTDGKPLWFNGWLLDNKFAERSKKRFASFKSYLIEPPEIQEPGAWTLAEANMCCLTVDQDRKFDFNEKEVETLGMIMERAREIGAFGNQR